MLMETTILQFRDYFSNILLPVMRLKAKLALTGNMMQVSGEL